MAPIAIAKFKTLPANAVGSSGCRGGGGGAVGPELEVDVNVIVASHLIAVPLLDLVIWVRGIDAVV